MGRGSEAQLQVGKNLNKLKCVSRVRPNMILNMYVIRFLHTQWYIYTAIDPCGINKVQSVAERNGPSISSPMCLEG